MRGTPPRRRGGRLWVLRRCLTQRNTPASAGRTAGPRSRGTSAPEHPRVGGEDSHSGRPWEPFSGTPPRRRGGRLQISLVLPQLRNTPASAGRTATSAPRTPARAEHPRVGGEDHSVASVLMYSIGTPPRRRGGRQSWSRNDDGDRNTPASAGRTAPPCPSSGRSPEHPRVGGEDPDSLSAADRTCGTPPRRRGGHQPLRRGRLVDRNTPASAGRTTLRLRSAARHAEHPRVGGEDAGLVPVPAEQQGTPPRRRGGLLRVPRGWCSDRNTPASAGRTTRAALGCRRSAEHPRVGGEDTTVVGPHFGDPGTPPRRRGGRRCRCRRSPASRNTPASAGRTGRSRGASAGGTEHPRVGGEDIGERIGMRSDNGTPPRRRGGPQPGRQRLRRDRNTPASAGRTATEQVAAFAGAEHPRVGGEDSSRRCWRWSARGTPPRRRGGR